MGEWDFELRPVRPGADADDAPLRSGSAPTRSVPSGRRDVASMLEELLIRIDELASSVDRVNRRLAAIEQNGSSEPTEGDTFGDVASRRLREARIARRLSTGRTGSRGVAPESSDKAPAAGDPT